LTTNGDSIPIVNGVVYNEQKRVVLYSYRWYIIVLLIDFA